VVHYFVKLKFEFNYWLLNYFEFGKSSTSQQPIPLGTKFYMNLRRQTPHWPSTMAGQALDGKPIQPTTSLPNARTIPLVLNGMTKNIRQQRSITNRTSDSHFKPGTSSYAAACTKIRPPVIRQQTHHDDAPHHPRNLPKLQKNQVLSEQQELRNYSTNLSHAIPNARPSSYPLPANQHLNE